MIISYKDRVTSVEVRRKIQAVIGEYDELLILVKKQKLGWLSHVSMSSGLAKTIYPTGNSEKKKKKSQTEEESDRRRGGKIISKSGQEDFASSTRAAENRTRWKGLVGWLFWV